MIKIPSHEKLTGSWIAAIATNQPLPPGTLSLLPGAHCPLCGYAFGPGEKGHANPTTGNSFNDAPSMKGGAREPTCSACIATYGKLFTQTLSKTVMTVDGAWGFASNEDRAYWLLNPPSQPFVMVCGLATNQHLFWRTPVARSRDIYPLRVGPHVGFIRRRILERVIDVAPRVMAAVHALAEANKKGRRPAKAGVAAHPYARLDRNFASTAHGTLKHAVRNFLASPEAAKEMAVLGEVNQLEAWALSSILNAPSIPAAPKAPIYTSTVPQAA